MEMQVKIKLSGGKEIELTKEEYEELKESLGEVKEVQQWFPYYPYQLYTPWESPIWAGLETISTAGISNCTIKSETIGDCNITTTTFSNGSSLTTSSVDKEWLEAKAQEFPKKEKEIHIYNLNN